MTLDIGFSNSEGPGPLDGIRVLDLGRYQAGPRCGLVLARLGADVIKIEPPGRGDESRANGPRVRGQSAYWVQYNSGKRSLSLNLRSEEGKEILRRLAAVADVFIQNFRPGTIQRMGFGYDRLKALNPRIVMVNVSAYGQYGPLRDRIGFDQVGQAMSGLMSLNGEPEGGPVLVPFPLVDRITALHAAIGALAALREREVSGEGQAIDVCLADSAYTTVEIPVAAYLGDGQVPARTGNAYHLANMFETADGNVYLANFASDNIFPRLADAIGRPEWKRDPGLASRAGRQERSDYLHAVLVNWFLEQTTEAAVATLNAASVPCAPVNTVPQAAAHPHLRERDVMVEAPDPQAGTIHVTGRTIKFSRSGMPVGPAPTVGEHTDAILSGLLGMGRAEIDDLRRAGVV